MQEIKPIPTKSTAPVDPEILKRVRRWQEEQALRKKKQQQREEEAKRKGITVKQLAEQRRAKYLLKNCHATIAEIVAAHKPKQG